jgi:hypothetical protein
LLFRVGGQASNALICGVFVDLPRCFASGFRSGEIATLLVVPSGADLLRRWLKKAAAAAAAAGSIGLLYLAG